MRNIGHFSICCFIQWKRTHESFPKGVGHTATWSVYVKRAFVGCGTTANNNINFNEIYCDGSHNVNNVYISRFIRQIARGLTHTVWIRQDPIPNRWIPYYARHSSSTRTAADVERTVVHVKRKHTKVQVAADRQRLPETDKRIAGDTQYFVITTCWSSGRPLPEQLVVTHWNCGRSRQYVRLHCRISG